MKSRALAGLGKWVAGAVCALVCLLPDSASASSIRTVLNGRELGFDVPPIVEQGRTLLPLRGVLEPLGAEFNYNTHSRTVTVNFGSSVITAVINQKVALVNGNPVELDVPPRALNGRTMIPVRFFAESVGLQVQWDGPTQTVYLGSRGDAPPDRSSTAGRTVSLLLESATSLIGTPYKWGGISPTSGFDCSGFVQYLLGQRGVKLPRTSQEQYKAGIPVSRSELQAGDLVFFETYAAGATHVGIADGKGNFVHAGSEKTGVLTTPLSNSWWAARYLGARRVLR